MISASDRKLYEVFFARNVFLMISDSISDLSIQNGVAHLVTLNGYLVKKKEISFLKKLYFDAGLVSESVSGLNFHRLLSYFEKVNYLQLVFSRVVEVARF